ncbi:hypothetical protein NC651_016125 [Populus alba x Populus x berolinensis]|nr:hypothetical protein NC651_016125 [Populus alba x Populus x berolinensis]
MAKKLYRKMTGPMLWTGEKMAAKEANRLPQLLLEGKARRFEINPPITISGTLGLYRVL